MTDWPLDRKNLGILGIALLGGILVLICGPLSRASRLERHPDGVRLSLFGHHGLSETFVALGTTRRLSLEWKLSGEALAPVVDEDFIKMVRSGAGFLYLAEMLSTYEALESGRFQEARDLAQATLDVAPARARAALVLGLLLEHVYNDPKGAGEVYVELAKHTEVPPWLVELGERLRAGLQDDETAHETENARQLERVMCGLLARARGESSYEQLAKKCQVLFRSERSE